MTDMTILEFVPDSKALFLQKEGDQLVEKIKALADTMPKDVSTDENKATLRSVASKIRSLKNRVDEAGKGMTDEWRNQTNAVNAERKRLWNLIETIEKEIRAPLTAYEEVEAAKKLKIEQNLAILNAIITGAHLQTPADVLQERLHEIQSAQYDWGDREVDGINAKHLALETLQKAVVARVKYDNEQKELEELRAMKAKQDEGANAAAEQKRIDDLAEQKKKDDAATEQAKQDKLAKDRKHKGAIHSAIQAKMVTDGKITAEQAKGIITLIAQGVIPSIKIIY